MPQHNPLHVYNCSADRPIALLGGIYGNVPALKACLDDAAKQECETVVFLGDSTGFCGHSDEVIDLLRQRCQAFVAGNHDVQTAVAADTCRCGHDNPKDEALSCQAHQYALLSVSDDSRTWLATLAELVLLRTPNGSILLCHGSPDQINEFLYESQLDVKRLEHWLDQYEATGMACTHTGIPWHLHLPGGRFATNVGVVGRPDNDGDTAVHYAVVRYSDQAWQVQIRRVVYAHEKWSKQLEIEGVPAVFTDPLKTGWWTVGVSSLPSHESERRK